MQFLKTVKIAEDILTRTEFFLARNEGHNKTKSSGRILLGDNTGGGAGVLRPITFQCVPAWISTGLPCIYIHS
jgi:hypothetical protein